MIIQWELDSLHIFSLPVQRPSGNKVASHMNIFRQIILLILYQSNTPSTYYLNERTVLYHVQI